MENVESKVNLQWYSFIKIYKEQQFENVQNVETNYLYRIVINC